jgi:DNA-binding MarR family transcriptional regulator
MALANAAAEGVQRRGGPLNFGSLTGLVGFNLRFAHLYYRDCLVEMKELDLTHKQFAVLTLIGANLGVSQIDLAASLGTDRATMMAMVDRLQDRGYLERAPSRTDRRRQELYLTRAGESARQTAEQICIKHDQSLLSRFSADELQHLRILLLRMHPAEG